MITKVGNSVVHGGVKAGGGLKYALPALPFAMIAAWKAPERYRASMSYANPMNNEYYREPGIFYDSLKRNPYVNNA